MESSDERRPTTTEAPPLRRRRGLRGLFRNADASIRARVLIPTVVLFAITIGLMTAVAVRLHSREMRHEQEQRSMIVARMVRSELAAVMLENGIEHVPEMLRALVEFRPDVDSISIVRASGEISSSSSPALIGTKPWGPMARYAEPTLIADRADPKTFAVVQPIHHEEACGRCHTERKVGETYGWLDVRVERGPTTDWGLARVLGLTAVPMLLILLGILWWLLGLQVVRPLHRLMAAMRGVRRGGKPLAADEGRPDELGEVARSFDATYAALRRAQREVEHFYRERSLQVDRFAAVGELATGLAHEIKNPLAGLSGALELLAEDVQPGFQKEIVTEMQSQLERLTQTMNGMLNFARPPKVMLSPTDVRGCLNNVMFLVRQHVRKQGEGIELRIEAGEGVPLALADATQLEQALLNIALNAVQAMRETGGSLTLRLSSVEDQINVQIADTGPGIPEKVRGRIFEPYFTTKGGGTGLGLALSARIIAEHAGRIEYECPPEGGTIFQVSLKPATTRKKAQELAG